jgi:hypothetical protein
LTGRFAWAGPLFIALCVSFPASSTAAPAPEPNRLQWEVNWDETQCSLIRRGTGDHPFSFVMALSPASRLAFLQLLYEGSGPPEGKVRLNLVFWPGEVRVPVDFEAGRTGRRNDLMAFTEADLLGPLELARSLTIAGSRPYLTIDLGEAGKAVASLRACRTDILREWGVDSAALDALRKLPELETPPSELPFGRKARANAPGHLLARLDVTLDGRVSACAVVHGSRGAEVDSKVCDLWWRNARFKPALGASGAPVAATIVSDFIWSIP